jgi:phospholipid/cholesterol/gamma-HCH transport system substrate-binding protein
VLNKFIPFTQNLTLALDRPGPYNDTTSLLAELPTVQKRASSTFPHAEDAIAAFQPQLSFARSYTPDLFNALGDLGAATGAYDGNGNYVRASVSGANLFKYGSGKLTPITRGEQFKGFTSTSTPRRCPGGATQPAADASNPYVNPPHGGSSVNPSECNVNQGTGG